MDRRLIGLFVFFAMVASAYWAEAQIPEAIQKAAEELIQANDTNGDGKLSLDEFPESKRDIFKKVDADRDRYVTAQEDMAYRISRSSKKDSTPKDRTKRAKKGAGQRRTEHDGDTRIERDIVYAVVAGSKLPLDLYIPEKAAAKGKTLPVVVWLHGGGWKGGSKGSGGIARGLVDHGYALVDVEYRLSDEALFPAQVQDCKAAIRWIRANADKYGLDPDHIGAMGRSAGGHLVAFLGTSGDTKEFDTDSNAGYSSRVQAVVDLWGPTDILQMDAHSLPGGKTKHDSTDSPPARLVGGPIQQEPYRALAVKVNPIKYIVKGQKIPPFLMVHGAVDLSVPVHQSILLHEALKKVGAETTLRIVEGAGHGLKGGEMDYDELREIAAEFFDKHLKPGN